MVGGRGVGVCLFMWLFMHSFMCGLQPQHWLVASIHAILCSACPYHELHVCGWPTPALSTLAQLAHPLSAAAFFQEHALPSASPPHLQEILYAASRGNNSRLRDFLEHGFEPDTADYGALACAARAEDCTKGDRRGQRPLTHSLLAALQDRTHVWWPGVHFCSSLGGIPHAEPATCKNGLGRLNRSAQEVTASLARSLLPLPRRLPALQMAAQHSCWPAPRVRGAPAGR